MSLGPLEGFGVPLQLVEEAGRRLAGTVAGRTAFIVQHLVRFGKRPPNDPAE